MDTQRQDNSAKKPDSAAVKRPDAFWGMIVPSTRLGKSRPSPTTRLRATYTPITHAKELKSTQPVARKEEARHEPVIRAQPVHSYISSTESLELVPSVQSDRHTDDDKPSEDKVLALDSDPKSVDSDEESSGGSDKTDGSDGDGECNDDDNETASGGSDSTEGSDGDGEYNEDSNETASDTSGFSTRRLHPSHRTSRSGSTSVRGRLGKLTKPSRITALKRKISSHPASTNDKRPKKRGRFVVDESEEDIEEEEEDDEALSVPHHVNRSTKDSAQTQQLSSLTTVPPLSRYYGAWTNDQEETLYRLRNEGKDWEYIGERVLGRTASGARGHWEKLRSESLKSLGNQNKGRLRRQDDPLVKVMAKTPQKRKPWSKEEEELLVTLRAQGMTLRYASRQIRGRGYSACKGHWRRIKDRYPFAISASKLARTDGKSVPSDSSNTSQLEQEAVDAGFDSRSATLEGDDLKSSTNGDPPITVVDTVPTDRLYAQAVLIHGNFVSANRSKRPKFKAPSTDHHDQQAANPTTVGEALAPGTQGSLLSNQPGMGSFNARRNLQKDLLLREPDILGNEGGKRKIGKHRRSNPWPY